MNKKIKLKKWQLKEFDDYKKNHKQKNIPKGLSCKEEDKWINENWIGYDKKRLFISGGGRVILWCAYIDGGLNKSFEKNIKNRHWGRAFEILQFIFRQKLLGVNLYKMNIDKDKLIKGVKFPKIKE